jgi:hypothetical protein
MAKEKIVKWLALMFHEWLTAITDLLTPIHGTSGLTLAPAGVEKLKALWLVR